MNVTLARQNSTSPSSVNDVDASKVPHRAAPTLAIREFFFSLLSEADRKRTDAGWNSAIRRFDGFIRFVSNFPERIRGTSAREGADLVWAARNRDMKTVVAKIAGHAAINHAEALGMTAMMYAAQNGDLEMVRTLITAGSAVNMQNKDGKTPLLLAIESDKFDVVDFLIKSGADVEKTDQNGSTPLMYAACYGCLKISALLLSMNVKAAVQNKEGWNALMLAARYGNKKIATTIMKTLNRKELEKILKISFLEASRLNQFAVLEAIIRANQYSNYPLQAAMTFDWVLKNSLKIGVVDALADSGMKLTLEQYRTVTKKYEVSENSHIWMSQVMVGDKVSTRTNTANFYASDCHLSVDNYLYAPVADPSGRNPLGLIVDGISPFSNLNHSTDSAGQYRHAIGKLHDVLPKLDTRILLDGMLDAGWRSRIAQLVNKAQKDAETAAKSEATKLLANPENGIFLIDQDGNTVSTDSIQFKETLLAFELGRNECLHQIAEPLQKAPGREDKTEIAEAEKHALAQQAQAQAILASNKSYVPLKLHMPSSMLRTVSKAKAIEVEVRTGLRTDLADALAEVDALCSETTQFFAEIMDLDTSDLARHWFLDQLTSLLDEMSCARDSIVSVAPH